MRVLDIDLDFFLDRISAHPGWDNGRLPANEYTPWCDADVAEFLENKCGLVNPPTILGRQITHHSEALGFWHEQIELGRLTTPFELIHIDAHSDLGADGTDARHFVATEYSHLPLEQRVPFPAERVTIGNFLLFALAVRWIGKFTLVQHAAYEPEIPSELLVYADQGASGLQVKRYTADEWQQTMQTLNPVSSPYEPIVPFDYPRLDEFQDQRPFDLITVCHSPNFTPATADPLLDVIARYFVPV